MQLKDTTTAYGSITRGLHWLMALAIVGMFALGLWMRGLDYYSAWYQTAPALHQSIGMVLAVLLAFRIIWRASGTRPDSNYLTRVERTVSTLAHYGLYFLLIILVISGYFIATADGRAIEVFNLFAIPAAIKSKGLEQLAGLVHEYTAYAVIGLAALHALAALKHHFINKNQTLTRMWSGRTD